MEETLATSYISEHSAEYYLVPELKKILERNFRFVVPLFPWITRELSNISLALHKNDKFQALAMFPRRPKLSESDPLKIYITFNSKLEEFKRFGEEHGVPVIAGCPAASNFWQLSIGSNFRWLQIGHHDLTSYLNSLDELEAINSPSLLNQSDIIELIENSQMHDFMSFKEFLRGSRDLQPYSFYGPQYKPVFFFCKKY